MVYEARSQDPTGLEFSMIHKRLNANIPLFYVVACSGFNRTSLREVGKQIITLDIAWPK